jgi:hypothetical protein
MRWKIEIWYTYRGTTQTEGKNPTPRTFFTRGLEISSIYKNVNLFYLSRKGNPLLDGVERCNFADLGKNYKHGKFCPRGSQISYM